MSIKKRIRNTFIGAYCFSLIHCAESHILPRLIDDKKAVKKFYKRKSGKELDLDNPISFSEKINWLKLYDRKPLMEQCADKVEVRSYVESKGLSDTLNDFIGVYDKVSEIDFNCLPDKYVIKASHGSHMNYIVTSKNDFNIRKAKIMMRTWLHQDIYWSGREWVYKNLKKRIVIEKYLEDMTGGLSDYKIFCFNGKPTFIQYNCNRFTDDIVQNFYDLSWNLLPFGKEIPSKPDYIVEKPDQLNRMIEMAEILSQPFQFVRVDLYETNGKVYFGELTFFPAGGAPDFVPEEYDEIVGKMWELKND